MQKQKHPDLSKIARAISALEPPFACGGSFALATPVELRFADKQRIRIDPTLDSRRNDLGKQLMKRCTPAVFGVGGETKRDKRVRDGGQLLANDGALEVLGLDLEASGIMAEIHRALCPGDPAPPTVNLYGMQVYPSGGRFVAHKDTPRGKNALGTLVVCLPVPFRGGRLVLRHGAMRAFVWERASRWEFRAKEDMARVDWAAFYGDVDHEVETVTEGTRVTLSWLIERSGTRPVAHPAADGDTAALTSLLSAIRDDSDFLPSGGTIGVPCSHEYVETRDAPSTEETLTESSTSKLKGRDRLVALAALRAGLSVRFRPYVFEDCAGDSWRLTRPLTDKERARFSRRARLDGTDLEDLLPAEHRADWHEDDDVSWAIRPPWGFEYPRKSRDDIEPATTLLAEVEYSATGYFGNESSDTAFYVAAGLLVDVPAKARTTKSHARPRPKRAGKPR